MNLRMVSFLDVLCLLWGVNEIMSDGVKSTLSLEFPYCSHQDSSSFLWFYQHCPFFRYGFHVFGLMLVGFLSLGFSVAPEVFLLASASQGDKFASLSTPRTSQRSTGKLWVAVLQEVLHILFKFVAIAAAGDVLDLSGLCFRTTEHLEIPWLSRKRFIALPTPSPAKCIATMESTGYTLPFMRFPQDFPTTAARNSQSSQELMLLIRSRRGINLCSNELGIPQVVDSVAHGFEDLVSTAPWFETWFLRDLLMHKFSKKMGMI